MHGVLLLQLGTPEHPTRRAVRRYLAKFLADKRVIDLPWLPRYILLYGFILPFRSRRTTKAYQAIWRDEGSPLLIHSQSLTTALGHALGPNYTVALGMRYSEPSISAALDTLKDCTTLTVLPLYPQYAEASTGSALAETLLILSKKAVIPSLRLIPSFYDHPDFIQATAARIKPYLKTHEHLLISYHGLPTRQLTKVGCLTPCNTPCSLTQLQQAPHCYRAQCFRTSTLLQQSLQLTEEYCTTAFQSRVGRTPWIEPYTDDVLPLLAAKGIKKLAITCPSFVSDCLETLEEIEIRAKAQWLSLGGERLTLIPALNNTPLWIDALQQLLHTP